MLASKRGILLVLLLTTINVQAQQVPTNKNNNHSVEQSNTKTTNDKKSTNKTNQKPLEQITINYDNQWGDDFHDVIANSVYHSALWFDSFFSLDINEQKHPKTSAKIRFGWLPKRSDYSTFKTRFRIKMSLPYLKDRADIILSDDEQADLSNLPLETLNSSQSFSQDSFSAALRYIHSNTKTSFTDTRVGISHGDIFARYRNRHIFSWQNKHGVKIEPAVYYFIQDGLGARLLLEYNYQTASTSQFRLNYSLRASESYTGQKWKYGIYHLHQLNNKTAALVGLNVKGRHASEEGSFTEQYKLSYRYRFNALKDWLYFEVEPFLEWSKEENFSSDPGIALQVEGFFEKN